jgi:hypothetical protein
MRTQTDDCLIRQVLDAIETIKQEQAMHDSKKKTKSPQVCPECQHVFQGNGWDGIDAHWKAKHENVMPYKEAWPLIKAGQYVNPRN